MVHQLGTATLKSGEKLEIVRVSSPDTQEAQAVRDLLEERPAPLPPEFRYLFQAVKELLAHKSPEWHTHMDAALRGDTGGLQTRFYLGVLDGRPVANVLTSEQHGIGIVSHVFTHPQHRQKGICRAVMGAQMEDFRARGGRALLLGTGFETPPYWIYHSFGFRSIQGGFMRYTTPGFEGFEEDWFAPRDAQIVPADWRHWPLVALLASLPAPERLRSYAWRLFGVGNLEHPYVDFMSRRLNRGDVNGVMLEAENGAVVGCGTLIPDAVWPQIQILDVFTHPNFTERLIELVRALVPRQGRILAYADANAPHKAAALEECSFVREGTLRNHLRAGQARGDVYVYARNGE
ncbi:MAG: GNAT family N-acetyltransferase [Chthonomonadales bacterium]